MSDFDNPPSSTGPIGTNLEEVAEPGPAPQSVALIPRARGGRPVALTIDTVTRMRELYYSFDTIETIAAALGCSPRTVARQIHKPRSTGLSWAQNRAEQQRLMSESIVSSGAALVQKASDRSIRLLYIGLEAYHKRALLDADSIDLKDLAIIAGIAEKLDKLSRLDGGKATTIVGMAVGEAITKEKIDSISKQDPFTTDAEFSESKDSDPV